MSFVKTSVEKTMPVLRIGFAVHDTVSDFVAKHLLGVKRTLLVVAYLVLFVGFSMPLIAKSLGNVALALLMITVLIGPLSKLTRMRFLYQLIGFRRELGIWFAFTAMAHGFGLMPNDSSITTFGQFWTIAQSFGVWYVCGLLAVWLSLPLLLTSNNFLTRLLGGWWKRLHRLTYVVFVLVLGHITLMYAFDPNVVVRVIAWTQFVLGLGGYILVKTLANNNFIAPLRELIDAVADRYGKYVAEKKTL